MITKPALRIGAVAAGAALALGAAGSAYAASGSGATPAASSSPSSSAAKGSAARLAAEKTLAAARIGGRIATLHALSLAVSDSKYLASSEVSVLSKQIAADLTGLTALATKASDETTVAAVRADEVAMVDDYRVYLLMAPQTHLTEALAAESDAATTLQKAYVALQQLVAKQSGGATQAQQSELANLQSEVTAAQSAIGDNAAEELAIQPGPNEDAIESALAPAKSATKTARADLVSAHNDAKELRASLKS